MPLSTPVALFIFNRPDLTEIVFESIRKVKPEKLLVIADGPRNKTEVLLCQQTREITERIDWNCEVLRNYSTVNLTSPIRCSTGLNWIFSEVEEAIILEDDCLPSLSFFDFCQNLLEYYRDDKRIMHISGSNFHRLKRNIDYTYCFSKYGTAWGWATWRRAWEKFDFTMKAWPTLREEGWIESIHKDVREQEYWTEVFDKCTFGSDPHWDYAWMYSCWLHGGLSIIPGSNLVSNLGCRADGTRHRSATDPLALIPIYDIETIQHPSLVLNDKHMDTHLFNFRFGRAYLKKPKQYQQVSQILRLSIKSLPQDFRDKYRGRWHRLKPFIKTSCIRIKRNFQRPQLPQLQNGEINLHLGCGSIDHPMFINIDAVPRPHVHYVRPIDNLSPFKDETVDLIYASHCLEHFPHNRVCKVLYEWHRVLKVNGILRISVPNFDRLINLYSKTGGDVEKVQGFLMGGQDYKLNFHMSIFNQASLTKLLQSMGFREIQEWHPGSSELTNFEDSSSLMVYHGGSFFPISLNLQAIK